MVNNINGIPEEMRTLLDQQLRDLTSSNPGSLSVSAAIAALVALWSASKAARSMMAALNQVYEQRETRKFVRLRLTSLALTFGAVLVLGAAVFVLTGFPGAIGGLPTLLRWTLLGLRWPALALIMMGGLAALYRFAPDRNNPRWEWVSSGAGVATVLWIVASIGFSVYASRFGNFNETYGTLGAIIVVMLWFWITGLVVLVGAEINAEAELQTGQDTTTGPAEPMGERDAYVADHVADAPGAAHDGPPS
jgi:membrane protein